MKSNKKISMILIDTVLICVLVVMIFVVFSNKSKKLSTTNETQLADTTYCATTDWVCGNTEVKAGKSLCTIYKTTAPTSGNSWNKLIDYSDEDFECKNVYGVTASYCCHVTTCEKKCKTCKDGYHLENGECKKNPGTCSVGQYRGQNNCEPCTPGYYCDGTDGNRTKCPSDKPNSPLGAKSSSECVKETVTVVTCNGGEYLPKNASKCSKCPAGSKCIGGTYNKSSSDQGITKCTGNTYSAEGQAKCNSCAGKVNDDKTACDCNVDNCRSCVSGDSNKCETCKTNYKVNASGKCYYSSGSSSTPKDACYKDVTNNEYVYGQYSNQANYTKVSDDETKCNKVLIKLVDDKNVDLQGAIITVTSSNDPTSPVTYSIGNKEIELLQPGTYTIKETASPSGYQIDIYDIIVVVDNSGMVNVTTTSSNVNLGTTNNSRNVTIIWQNLAVTTTSPSEEEDEEQCYIRHEDDGENNYCYGKKDACSDYSSTLEGRDEDSCKEESACYTTSTNEFITGKYANREGYKYYAATCPKCYKNKDGNLLWGSFNGLEGYTVVPDVQEADCKTETKEETKSIFDNSKLIYIILIIIIIIAIIIVASKGKTDKKKTNKDDEEKDDFNYNYRI